MKPGLLELAERALSTPLLEAADALDVLADALLEAGEIRTEGLYFRNDPGYAELVPSDLFSDHAVNVLRMNAVNWARGRTLLWCDARLVSRTPTLPPCEVTGMPCLWRSEEEYDEDGEMVWWDDFCEDCGQSRDFSKDVCPDPGEAAPERSGAERGS